jgi:transcriptional regulator with XRE-family HTH domain
MGEGRVKTIHDHAYQVLVDCLKKARQDAGLTQADLATSLGTDQSYVSKYERSERRLDVLELRAICHEFGLTLSQFVDHFEKELRREGVP